MELNALSLVEAAEAYTRLGLAVFPLLPRSKEPATAHGLKDATTDLRQIRRWWKRNPQYNIGLATGEISGGLCVIDLDAHPEKGRDGFGSFERMARAAGGDLPDTWTATTGSGGRHLVYKTGEPLRNAADIMPGVDIRANGGYIVAPPSIHPGTGRPYTWDPSFSPEDLPLAELPADLLPKRITHDFDDPFEAPEEILEGGRVATLVQEAGALSIKGFSMGAIEAAIRAENEAKCVPPLTEEELQREVFPAIRRFAEADAPKLQEMKEKAAASGPVRLTSLDDIEERRAEWLIKGYLPKNQITILAGDGGSGKTSIWCNIAAAVSSGRPSILEEGRAADPEEPAEAPRRPKKVIYFSSEDSSTYVLKRRLRQNGAAMERILTVDMADSSFGTLKFNSPQLRKILEEERPALCIFDPLQAFVPDGVNMGYRNEMRNQLAPLISYGEQYDTTFLVIMHANKQSGVWGRKRMADSSDMWDIARSVLMVGETGENGQRYISQEKSNYGQLQSSVLFTIQEGRTDFAALTDKRDRDYMIKAYFDRPTPTRELAEDAIRDALETSGEIRLDTLRQLVEGYGISKKVYDQARKKLQDEKKIEVRTVGMGKGKGKLWLVRSAGAPMDYDPEKDQDEEPPVAV